MLINKEYSIHQFSNHMKLKLLEIEVFLCIVQWYVKKI